MYRESRLSMSTVLTVLICDSLKPDWDDLFDYADHLAARFDHRLMSPIRRLNENGRARLPEEVLKVVRTSLTIASLSGGAFDPSILPLTALWSFESGGVRPIDDDILEAREKVDFQAVRISEEGLVTIPPDFGLDLGGIAKGAVVDGMAEYLVQRGYSDFLIEAGGDITVSGLKGKKQWVIAIKHPGSSGDFSGVISIGERGKRVSIVTSGDYERFFEYQGQRYHHIIDPHTGFPAEGLASVTVITSSCTVADALATAAFVLGIDKGFDFLEDLPDTEGLLIEDLGGHLSARVTSGFPLSVEELNLNPSIFHKRGRDSSLPGRE